MSDYLQTRQSLLIRIKTHSNERDWADFYRQYSGIILSFCRKRGLDDFGAQDVLQETMILIMRKLPDFEYDPAVGRFRNWLLALVAGKVRDALRRAWRNRTVSLDGDAGSPAEGLAESLVSEAVDGREAVEKAWQEGLVEEALRRIQCDPKIRPDTLAAFRAYVIEEVAVNDVAARFGIQVNAVYQIKNRLLKRVREEVSKLELPAL